VLSARVQLDPSDTNRARLQTFLNLLSQTTPEDLDLWIHQCSRGQGKQPRPEYRPLLFPLRCSHPPRRISAGSRHPCLVPAAARADLLIDVDRAGPRATRSSFGARWRH
jgi:hypothetical protein